MSQIIKWSKTIRTHWKKSIFFSGSIAYGVSYFKERYEINKSMRAICEEASKFGDTGQFVHAKSRKVLVIVNPVADRRSSFENFEAYCAPILHLAGIAVEVLKTDSEGHAQRYVESIDRLPDAIVVAGGDGTVCESITGLLRRSNKETCPIGIIPTGRTNTLSNQIFGPSKLSKLKDVQNISKAALSIVQGTTALKDIMKIEIIPQENETIDIKPIYAISSIHWGAFRDALSLRDKYWYFGPLRDYVTFLFNGFDNNLSWDCHSILSYADPCTGCSNCYTKRQIKQIQNKRWWSVFVPKYGQRKSQIEMEPDFSKIVNEQCSNQTQIETKTTELLIENNSNRPANEPAKISIKFGPENVNSFEFIANSWHRIRTRETLYEKSINARTIELIPETVSNKEDELFFSIDNEAFEVKPIRISVIPKAIEIFIP